MIVQYEKGMHLLEMAKLAWNRIVTSAEAPDTATGTLEEETRVLLSAASRILDVYGPEGDQGCGPLHELGTLKALLDS